MFKKGDVVWLCIHRSHKLPKGSLGVVMEDCRPSGVDVEWRRGVREWVHMKYLKPATLERLSNQQRLWLIKRRMRSAAGLT